MSKKTEDALRNARYNFAVTDLDVQQCQLELIDAEKAVDAADEKVKAAQAKLERAHRTRNLASMVLSHKLVEHGPATEDGGIPPIDERDKEFAAEQAAARELADEEPFRVGHDL